MKEKNAVRMKELTANVGIFSATTSGIVAGLIAGYYTVYDGAISAVNAIFHTKSAEQFVWGALRFWFGFAGSVIVGAIVFFIIALIASRIEHYYMRKIGEARRSNNQ